MILKSIVERIKIANQTFFIVEPQLKYWKDITEVANENRIGLGIKPLSIKSARENFRKTIASHNKGDSVTYLLLGADGQYVGHVDLRFSQGRRHIAEIGIGLKKTYRGKGIGTALQKRMIAYAKKKFKKLEIIEGWTWGTNKGSVRLMKRLGFKMVAKIPHIYKVRGKYVDKIGMQLIIRRPQS